MLLMRYHIMRLFCIAILVFTMLAVWIQSKNTTKPLTGVRVRTTAPPSRILTTVYPSCGSGKIAKKGQYVKVNGTKTLLVSAFQEHRSNTREVRVITISLRSQEVTYLCLFCCEGQIHISKGKNWIQSSHFNFDYGTSHLMCTVPASCQTPSYVSVVSTEVDSVEVGPLLTVGNQEPREKAFPHNFTVCISTMFEFSNVLQLVQSFEMLKILGVTRVVVYRTSSSHKVQGVLDYYTQTGLVEVIPWRITSFLNVSWSWLPQLSAGDIHYFGQIPALNDCLYRNMYQARYLAHHDIDELIIPQTVDSWPEMFPLLEKSHGTDQCYSFENNVFPTNVILGPPKSETLHPDSIWHPGSQDAPGINILAHLYQEPSEKLQSTKRKLIFNPRGVISPNIHELMQANIKCSFVNRDVGRMYHTRSPLQPELTPDKLVYDGRLLNYSSRLIPAITSVLRKSGLTSRKTTSNI